MSMTLFAALEQVLQANEGLQFTLRKQSDGRMLLLLQPYLRKDAENVPKEAEQARAMLALPLRLIGPAAELDANFASRIEGYAKARGELRDQYHILLDALKEATKEAKNKTAQAGKSSVSKPKDAAASTSTASQAAAKSQANISTNPPQDSSDGGTGSSRASQPASNIDMQQPLSLL